MDKVPEIDNRVQYFVFNENTLCYLQEGDPRYGVLAGSTIRGGRNPLDGMVIRSDLDRVRQATLADFDAYRIMPPRDYATVHPRGRVIDMRCDCCLSR